MWYHCVSRYIFSASQFPRSRNRGRNRGISYLKRNFQCETENAFLLKAPYLSFASPPDKNHSRTRRHVKNISVNLCPAWLVLADRASTASTDFPDYKRSISPPPTVTYHSSWHVSLRNSRRMGRGNVVVAHACTRYGPQLQRGI